MFNLGSDGVFSIMFVDGINNDFTEESSVDGFSVLAVCGRAGETVITSKMTDI
jgi:hypothetical protein